MRYIDVTGKTEAEAIEKALAQLGLSRDDVSVEILERAKSGFLGLGSSPAKVRVTYDDPAEEEKAPVVEEPKAAPVEKKPEAPKVQPEKKAEKKSSKPQAERKPEAAPAPKAEEKKEEPKAAPAELGEEIHDAKSEQIRQFLSGLIAHMDAKAEVKVYLSEKDRYKVYLEGEKLGQLIGRRGETLDAMQQLTS